MESIHKYPTPNQVRYSAFQSQNFHGSLENGGMGSWLNQPTKIDRIKNGTPIASEYYDGF